MYLEYIETQWKHVKSPNKPNEYPLYIGNQEFGFVSHLGVPGIMAQVEDEKTDLFSYLSYFCE